MDLEERIKRVVPEDSFLGHYFKLGDLTEAPFAYDFWCGLWCLSNAVMRTTVVDRPNAPVHLNLYIVLAADSGVTRKTTSVSRATDVVREAFIKQKQNILFVQSRASKEKIERDLAVHSKKFGYAHTAFAVPEFVSLVGKDMHTMGLPALLTDLYDVSALRESVGTISRGEVILKHIYSTLLAASTPTWLVRAISPQIIEGGFTSRCFFVFEEQRKKAIAWQTEDGTLLYKMCVKLLSAIIEVYKTEHCEDYRRIRIDAYALESFKSWYTERNTSIDPFLASFDAREDAHVLKVAALLAINAGTNTIQEEHLKVALLVIEQVKKKSATLLSYQSSGELVNQIEKLRSILITKQDTGITHSELMRQMAHACRAKRLNSLLNIMHELGMVKRFIVQNRRASTVWVAHTPLFLPNFFELILEQMEAIEG